MNPANIAPENVEADLNKGRQLFSALSSAIKGEGGFAKDKGDFALGDTHVKPGGVSLENDEPFSLIISNGDSTVILDSDGTIKEDGLNILPLHLTDADIYDEVVSKLAADLDKLLYHRASEVAVDTRSRLGGLL